MPPQLPQPTSAVAWPNQHPGKELAMRSGPPRLPHADPLAASAAGQFAARRWRPWPLLGPMPPGPSRVPGEEQPVGPWLRQPPPRLLALEPKLPRPLSDLASGLTRAGSARLGGAADPRCPFRLVA